MSIIRVNRAPVMTLWGAVVAERLGYDPQEALSLGRAVAGMNAQSKGQRLGIYEPGEQSEAEGKEPVGRQKSPPEPEFVDLLGRSVPTTETKSGRRAVSKGKPVEPAAVQRYLERKFGDRLPEVRAAMQELAGAYSPQELAGRAYGLYEKFRPQIPEGTRGWGAEGDLDLEELKKTGR